MVELRGFPLGVAVVMLAESIDFMMSATAMHTPPFMVARYIIKICVALAIFVRPCVFRELLSRKGFCFVVAIAGCVGALLLFFSTRMPLVMVGSVLVTGSEACLFVGQALILFTAARDDVLKASMTGVLLAFAVAVVSFALPRELSLIMQMTAVCLLAFLANGVRTVSDSADVKDEATRTPILPGSLVAVLVLFSLGTQFAFMFGDIDCDWAMVYALGAFAGAGVMVLEFRLFAFSKISTLDITCALFIAVPVMLVGMGDAAHGVFMSLVNVGNCLFLPRMFQIILRSSEEDRIDPARGVCLAYIVVTASVMAVTLLGMAGVFATANEAIRVVVSIVVAVGCIFSAFILYSARVRDDAFEYIRTNERNEGHDSSRSLVPDAGNLISSDDLRRIAEELYLTRREAEVLALLVAGRDLDGVGVELCIAMSTVKTHVLHIYQKFDVHSRDELIDALNGRCSRPG